MRNRRDEKQSSKCTLQNYVQLRQRLRQNGQLKRKVHSFGRAVVTKLSFLSSVHSILSWDWSVRQCQVGRSTSWLSVQLDHACFVPSNQGSPQCLRICQGLSGQSASTRDKIRDPVTRLYCRDKSYSTCAKKHELTAKKCALPRCNVRGGLVECASVVRNGTTRVNLVCNAKLTRRIERLPHSPASPAAVQLRGCLVAHCQE